MAIASGNDSNAVTLLHLDGSSGSTAISDTAIGGTGTHVWTPHGGFRISSGTYALGGAAGIFDGTGAYGDTPWTTDFAFGTGAFTWDLWVNFNSLPATSKAMIFAGWSVATNTNRLNFYLYNSAGTYQLYFTGLVNSAPSCAYYCNWTPSLHTWYHLAVVRSGTNVLFFINGISQSLTVTTSIASNTVTPTVTSNMMIGRWGITAATYAFDGYLDEIRISNVARWTATFTPPIAEYGQGLTKGLSDTTTLSDSRKSNPKLIKSDILTLSDARSNKVNLLKTDILSLAESVANKPKLVKSDSMPIGESIANTPKLVKSDSISLSESIVKKPKVLKADSITLSDALSKFLHVKKADIISLTDSVSKKFNLNKSDVITLLDFFSYVLHVVAIFLNLSDNIYLSDVIKKSPHLFKSDALTILDQNIKQYRLGKQDFIFLSDVFLRSARPSASSVFEFVHKKRTEQQVEQGGDFGFIHTKRITPKGKTDGDFSFTHKKRSKN